MKRCIILLLLVGVCLVAPGIAHADENAELTMRVAALEEKIASLEKVLRPFIAKAEAEQRVNAQRLNARKRMRQDAGKYSADELREIESLYQVANKEWRTPKAKLSLQQLVEKYDKANRTGCALLYLGQMSKGKDRVEYLTKAAEKFGDCYYGDGVQVGAYARLLLGQTYLQEGEKKQAAALFEELRKNYPQAIDHRGNHLVAQLEN
ncbi:tetratricopeptide repeat protein [Adhaeretor mobilis]|uniref:Uncharacterized protein n=1 Tax=Adhaeretor mobilis TaxID=1930276 RepID=A0A517MQU9_9BACT|nr:tetratricopeptide repeat protein [Adhaeretor mobilis]QDS97260.1 hypothetical protein HG15A2_05210 [Adhaeretor mobilis]